MERKPLVSVYSILIFVFTGCISNPGHESNTDYTKTFKTPYGDVWRAIQQTLINYPMNINNMEIGHLQTLYITGSHRYQPPHEKKKPLPQGYQYQLDIHLLKGKKNKTKVIVSKKVRLQQDFFSEPKDLSSDGFEEQAFLYRVHRELFIDKMLKKRLKKQKKRDREK